MSVFLLLDPRQATVSFGATNGTYLASVEYPACWTPHEDLALRFTAAELDELEKGWPYLSGCKRIPTDKILFVGLRK